MTENRKNWCGFFFFSFAPNKCSKFFCLRETACVVYTFSSCINDCGVLNTIKISHPNVAATMVCNLYAVVLEITYTYAYTHIRLDRKKSCKNSEYRGQIMCKKLSIIPCSRYEYMSYGYRTCSMHLVDIGMLTFIDFAPIPKSNTT